MRPGQKSTRSSRVVSGVQMNFCQKQARLRWLLHDYKTLYNLLKSIWVQKDLQLAVITMRLSVSSEAA